MPLQYQIILAIGFAALIDIILCFFGGAGLLPKSKAVGGEEWDSPFLAGFLLGLAALILDVIAAGLLYIWDHDPSHLAAPILAVSVVVLIEMWIRHAFEASLFSWWRKLVPVPTAAAPKKPWLSKTIVLNGMVAAGLLAEAKLSFLQGVLPASKYQIVAFVLPFLNMLLRAYTTQGLSLGSAAPATETSQ